MATAFQIPSSNFFKGNDGPWSTFLIQVGTPPGTVNVLPASSLDYLIVIDSEFCSSTDDLKACTDLKGGLFNYSDSTTFLNVTNSDGPKGQFILPFPLEEDLHPLQCTSGCNNTGKGYFADSSSLLGVDTVKLAEWDGTEYALKQQPVAPFRGAEPDLGLLGLAPGPFNFSRTQSYLSPHQALWDEKLISSQYWAYHAGSYRENTAGSLTFGGYDKNRGDLGNAQWWDFDGSQNLAVKISNIAINVTSSATFPASYTVKVDTTIPELWLPASTCEFFEQAFGLEWNEAQYMYLLSEGQRQSLLDQNPTVNFTLDSASPQDSGNQQEFTLHYSSFDLTVKWPLGGIDEFGQNSYYFPLKRANSPAQYRLGRAFFQELYLGVDYDQQRLCMTPAQISDSVDLVNVNHRRSSGLSTGAIAGIVVGGVAFLISIIALAIILFRRHKRRKEKTAEDKQSEQHARQMSEQASAPLYGYFAPNGKRKDVEAKDPASELPSPDLNQRGFYTPEIDSRYYDPSEHRRTLSGGTLAMNPASQTDRPELESRLSQGSASELETIRSRQSQQSPTPRSPSRYELDTSRGVYEMSADARSHRSIRRT